MLRLWLVIVGDAGAAGVGDSHIDRDIVAVLAPVKASAVDSEVGFGNAVVDDHDSAEKPIWYLVIFKK